MKPIHCESLLPSHDPVRSHRLSPGLIGALLIGAGLASSLAIADETTPKDQSEVIAEKSAEPVQAEDTTKESEQVTDRSAKQERDRDADMVRVRISLPDGREIIRLEPVRSRSARRTARSSSTSSTSRYLPDGSRISVGGQSVSGGSNSASLRHGSSGGGGGGSASSHSGGGGGGGVVTTKAVAKEVRSKLNTQVTTDQGQENELGSADLAGLENESFEMNTSTPGGTNNASAPSSGGTFARHQGARAVPTIGGPRFDREGNATGGQRVEFHDAGMDAAVIGNMVYLNGVELVNADQPFSVVTGTRIGTDSVVMDDQRFSPGDGPLGSFNTGSSAIKIELEQGTVVDLVMLSRSDNPSFPDRQERTWTVRIR